MNKKEQVILVLEDEQPLLEAIKIKLEKNGFKVVTARSVIQALDYLEQLKSVDAIWLDHYLLGKENGLDFVAKCRAEKSKYKKIPIFVVSNTATNEKVDAYLHLGIAKYYVKAEKRLDDIINEIKKIIVKK